jgi:hypothetical protein
LSAITRDAIDLIKPALLTKTELDWLRGNVQVSSEYERQIRSRIKRKVQSFQKGELPLLMEKGFTFQSSVIVNADMTAGCHEMIGVTANCHSLVAKTGQSEGFVNLRSRVQVPLRALFTNRLIVYSPFALPG